MWPHDSLGGTLLAGLILTVALAFLARILASSGLS